MSYYHPAAYLANDCCTQHGQNLNSEVWEIAFFWRTSYYASSIRWKRLLRRIRCSIWPDTGPEQLGHLDNGYLPICQLIRVHPSCSDRLKRELLKKLLHHQRSVVTVFPPMWKNIIIAGPAKDKRKREVSLGPAELTQVKHFEIWKIIHSKP